MSANPYLWMDEGWLYLAIVLYLFNRAVVGWPLKPRITANMGTLAGLIVALFLVAQTDQKFKSLSVLAVALLFI